MLGDIKVSAPKGKTREDSSWHAEWWALYSLIDRPRKPVVWTNCSIVFTAHSLQPLVTGRIFPSSEQFVLHSPEPIFSSPSSYEPPSVISVSPNDDWLFAYFPRRAGDGTGCLWRRGLRLDNWNIKDYWGFGRGAGVVSTAWAGTEREWATDDVGSTTRLPPRGPVTPMSSPTLLLVTEDHQLNMCYLRAYMPSLKVMKCSLTQPSMVTENQPHSMRDIPNGQGGVRVCIGASIGLAYNESTILVAMRSRLHPSPNVAPSSFNTMDLGLSLDVSQSSIPEPVPSIEWESWGEETTIELCEVQIVFDGYDISISTNPLPPIYHSCGPQLTQISFLCAPSTGSDPTKSPASMEDSKSSKRTGSTDGQNPGQIYLAASFIDFGDCSSLPQSELVLYTLSRNAAVLSSSKASWLSKHHLTRSFSTGVLAFIIPRVVLSNPQNLILYAGVLDSGTAPTAKRESKEVPIGRVSVLNLNDLTEDDQWEQSTMMVSADSLGRELPLNAAVSPNNILLSTLSSSLLGTRTTVYPLPIHKNQSSERPNSSSLSSDLVTAIHSRKTTSDITHVLSLASNSTDQIADTLYATLSAFFEKASFKGMSSLWTWEVLGVAVETYRAKISHPRKQDDVERLLARLQTARDLCSVAACNTAFDDCKEGEAYDLEAVWQLVGMSQWALEFVEKLMKQCLLLNVAPASEFLNESIMDVQSDGEDLFGSAPTSPAFEIGSPILETPALLHVAHPYALTNLHTMLMHVKSLHLFLGHLSARGENAQIARDVLVDLVNCSGIDIDALCAFVAESVQDAKAIPVDDALRSLALCQPTTALRGTLRRAIEKLTDGTIINKPRLFVKSSDLVDGTSRMSFVERPTKGKKDIVSKALLAQCGVTPLCMRCGGQSEVGGDIVVAGNISLRWRAWEKVWTLRCICGGLWAH